MPSLFRMPSRARLVHMSQQTSSKAFLNSSRANQILKILNIHSADTFVDINLLWNICPSCWLRCTQHCRRSCVPPCLLQCLHALQNFCLYGQVMLCSLEVICQLGQTFLQAQVAVPATIAQTCAMQRDDCDELMCYAWHTAHSSTQRFLVSIIKWQYWCTRSELQVDADAYLLALQCSLVMREALPGRLQGCCLGTCQALCLTLLPPHGLLSPLQALGLLLRACIRVGFHQDIHGMCSTDREDLSGLSQKLQGIMSLHASTLPTCTCTCAGQICLPAQW